MTLGKSNHLRFQSRWFLVTFGTLLIALFPVLAIAKLNPCQEQLVPLGKQLDQVMQQGGIWSQFEKYRDLRGQSPTALQLDSKMKRLLFSLQYLCETLDGIPFNDLAEYVDKEIRLKGESRFRKDLDILGKSEAEVEIWLTFREFAVKNQHRKLDESSVTETIKKSRTFFERYEALWNQIKPGSGQSTLDRTRQLSQDLDDFHIRDSNLAQATSENAQVPYWDFDENHGGS